MIAMCVVMISLVTLSYRGCKPWQAIVLPSGQPWMAPSSANLILSVFL